MQTEVLVLKPFNGVFFGVFALFLFVFILISLSVRKKNMETRKQILASMMLFTLFVFILYKVALCNDAGYALISMNAGTGGFSWWKELPLQLCNINMILIPVAMLTDNKAITGFCFFAGPLGAVMALLMPAIGFNGYSLLLPRMMGYYFTHCMVLFGGISIVSFGIYKPRLKDIPGITLGLVAIVTVIFGINMLLRCTGLSPHSNYFYVVETEGNPLLEVFYGWIPHSYFYIFPCLLIFIPYAFIVTAALNLGEKFRSRALN